MNASIDLLERKNIAATGAVEHLTKIEEQVDLLRAHINMRTGLICHAKGLKRLQEAARVLKRDVLAEKGRIERRLAVNGKHEP